jgi:hypothetical protein
LDWIWGCILFGVSTSRIPTQLLNNVAEMTDSISKNIVFFHPDLGIGGAERLVIDAAVGLQNRGHMVTIFTSHCDPNHCFEEARNGKLSADTPPLLPTHFIQRI